MMIVLHTKIKFKVNLPLHLFVMLTKCIVITIIGVLRLALGSAIVPQIHQLNIDEFERSVMGTDTAYSLVEFFSPTCYHCQSYARSIEEALEVWTSAPSKPDLSWYQFSCAASGDYCQRKLGLRAIPSVRMYTDGFSHATF